ncbi:hypothetical protein NIES4101_79650 [Calothrix sp. NIES-4101]|nr:hypothetical protein NIES4101_79650 [Calothrix sp. NIES-4101]
MNVAFPRLLKSAYRKDPIVSVLITMGLIDALIGGFDDSWSLFAFGLGTAGLTLCWRLFKIQQNRPLQEAETASQLYLPPRSSSSALPMLSVQKKKPPQ